MTLLTLGRDGAEVVEGGAASCISVLELLANRQPNGRAGIRLVGDTRLSDLLSARGQIGSHVAARLGTNTRPVRAVLFDKSTAVNWSLGWHQDRTIAVAQRVDADGFGPWTVKQGIDHVAPPIELLQQMITVRAHLDPVPRDNAPLLIAPGSHRAGLVPVGCIEEVVGRCGTYACLAQKGDLWLYSTPILHCSETARKPRRRRVLQVDYATEELPGALRWLGV